MVVSVCHSGFWDPKRFFTKLSFFLVVFRVFSRWVGVVDRLVLSLWASWVYFAWGGSFLRSCYLLVFWFVFFFCFVVVWCCIFVVFFLFSFLFFVVSFLGLVFRCCCSVSSGHPPTTDPTTQT